jgi:chromosomal replication initiator protein
VITVQQIKRATAGYFGVPAENLEGPQRRRPLVYYRQLAMYLAREMTSASYSTIGRAFGGRDHTTVIYSVRKMGARLSHDDIMARHAQAIRRRLFVPSDRCLAAYLSPPIVGCETHSCEDASEGEPCSRLA